MGENLDFKKAAKTVEKAKVGALKKEANKEQVVIEALKKTVTSTAETVKVETTKEVQAQAQAIDDAAGADKQANKEAMAAAKKALKASKEVKKNKKESKAAIAKAQGQMVQAKQKGDWSKYKDDVVKVEQAKQKLDKLDGNAQIATNEATKTEKAAREAKSKLTKLKALVGNSTSTNNSTSTLDSSLDY